MTARIATVLAALALGCGAIAASTPDPLLMDQFRRDLITELAEKSPGLSDEQQKASLDSIINEPTRSCPSALTLTGKQLEILHSGQCPFTDEQIQQTYAELKQLVADKPMPVLVELYRARLEAGGLNPVQKTIYFNFASAITENLRRAHTGT